MNKLKLIFGSGLVVPMLTLSPVMVLAQSGTDSRTETTTTESSDESTAPVTAEEAAKKLADMKKRLEERKTALKTKLDEVSKKRITNKCKASQNLVKGAETSAKAISANRSKAYTKIAEKVQSLIDKLKANGNDTTELEAALAVAKQKSDTLASAMETYEQTLADLREMDCTSDPVAFQATLDTARTQREAIKVAANDLRVYISTTLKEAIRKLRTEIEAEKKTEDTTSTDATGGTR